MLFKTILIDPPWPKKKTGSLLADRAFRSAEHVYPTMTIEQIKAMPIAQYADVGAHLWLWITNGMLPHFAEVMQAWCFTYHAPIVWRKPSGNGNFFIHRTEFLMFGYYKKCYFRRARYMPNDYTWPKEKEHSRKPEGSYQLIESISEEPRLEIFARRRRDGWHSFGNEIKSDLIIPTREKETDSRRQRCL
ncbi:MAG TPA: MT-A70 family methyltransferase [Blastocatellia bacterium]|nr:MT-A70 family methyltransferase [Blastocatellia bacterium]